VYVILCECIFKSPYFGYRIDNYTFELVAFFGFDLLDLLVFNRAYELFSSEGETVFAKINHSSNINDVLMIKTEKRSRLVVKSSIIDKFRLLLF